MTTGKPPTRDWMMKAVELETDCDIAAGPVLPVVVVTCPAPAASEPSERLNSDEKRLLNEFVQCLREKEG